MNKETDRNFVKALAKGMKILNFIVNSREPVGITQIAKELSLSIGAVQRLTYTFVSMGYLRKNEINQGYTIGHNAWAMGLSIAQHISLRRVARPHLEALSYQIGEAVNLAVLDGTEIIYVDRIKTGRLLDININVGLRLPAYCTSMGNAMLAFLPHKELLSTIEKTVFEPLTPNTITNKDKLLKKLKEIKKRGFSICNGETDEGLRSIAAPIRDSSKNVIAAANISVLSSKVTLEKLKKFSTKIINVTKVISEGLGYNEQ